jgi:hypothetical protein
LPILRIQHLRPSACVDAILADELRRHPSNRTDNTRTDACRHRHAEAGTRVVLELIVDLHDVLEIGESGLLRVAVVEALAIDDVRRFLRGRPVASSMLTCFVSLLLTVVLSVERVEVIVRERLLAHALH